MRNRYSTSGDVQVEPRKDENEVFPMVTVEPDPEVSYPWRFFIDWPEPPTYQEVRAPGGKPRGKRPYNALREAVMGSSAGVMRAARRKRLAGQGEFTSGYQKEYGKRLRKLRFDWGEDV
jgi:hypothetical protein